MGVGGRAEGWVGACACGEWSCRRRGSVLGSGAFTRANTNNLRVEFESVRLQTWAF